MMNIIALVVLVVSACGLFYFALWPRKKNDTDSRLSTLEDAIQGIEAFSIGDLEQQVIAAVTASVDNHPRCCECNVLIQEKVKFCANCGHEFPGEPPPELKARITGWRIVTKIDTFSKSYTQFILDWTCLDCGDELYDAFSESTMNAKREFIHALLCEKCNKKVGEVVLDTERNFDASVVTQIGPFGSLRIEGSLQRTERILSEGDDEE